MTSKVPSSEPRPPATRATGGASCCREPAEPITGRKAGRTTSVGGDTLHRLQRDGYAYFPDHTDPASGLVLDSTRPDAPASIAVVGFALGSYPVAVERGWSSRRQAAATTRATLEFFHGAPHGPHPMATGHRGFYYHFLDPATGERHGRCELSTIDTTLLLAGALAAASYFDRPDPDEARIRVLAEELVARPDWNWARDGGATVTHGWRPESGFLPHRWRGYDEALLLYLLGLGSPSHPLPAESYGAWTSGYRWRRVYGRELLYAGPLFIHQYSHVWVDFRGIRDAFMRGRGIDYFENSRRATLLHRDYAIRNPEGFAAYCRCCWGLTASDGPGPAVRRLGGREVRFHDYLARGAPFGPDDGTVAPWAAVASLPFAPEEVLETMDHFHGLGLGTSCPYGFEATFNATYPVDGEEGVWVSPWNYGLNQGPLVLMIENHRTGLLWELLRDSSLLRRGLRRAGFRGGWL